MTTAPSQRLVAELALALADLWAAELNRRNDPADEPQGR